MMIKNIFLKSLFVFIFLQLGNRLAICSDTLTYFKHIKPIIDEKCTDCHRIGQTGPFSLESYDDLKKRIA